MFYYDEKCNGYIAATVHSANAYDYYLNEKSHPALGINLKGKEWQCILGVLLGGLLLRYRDETNIRIFD